MRDLTQSELLLWYNSWRPEDKHKTAVQLKIAIVSDGRYTRRNIVERSIDEMPSQNRALIHARDKQCAYCGVSNGNLTVDHYIPLSAWPENLLWLANTSSNLVSACWDCNKAKSVKVAEEPPYKNIWPIVKFCNECEKSAFACTDCDSSVVWCAYCQMSAKAVNCKLPKIECENQE